MTLTTTRTHLLAFLLLALGACGDGSEPSPTPPRPTAGSAGPGPSALRPAVGQEIWLTYYSPPHAHLGRRSSRTRDAALALARDLRARVEAGEDIGALAREHSNMPGGVADGFTSFLPRDPRAPDARDKALLGVSEGELTGIVEWNGGFLFARRVPQSKGVELQKAFEEWTRRRVSIQAIWLTYVGLPVLRFDDKPTRTREEARRLAGHLHERAMAGEDFGKLAEAFTDDPACKTDGGLVRTIRPGGEKTIWLRWGEPNVPANVIAAAFETPEGAVHSKVIDDPQNGLFLIRVRKQVR